MEERVCDIEMSLKTRLDDLHQENEATLTRVGDFEEELEQN